MAGPKSGILQGAISCSICLEAISDASERSIAKLICGHQFHLDCIGSAFNAKGSMQCPNCRQVENGQWLYANGVRQREDSFFEDMMNEEDYDVLAGVSELLFPQDLMHVGHLEWCPYQGSYAQLSLSVGGADHLPTAHADLVVNVLVGDNVESIDSLQPCPYVLAQAPTVAGGMPGVENVQVQDNPVRALQGGPPPQYSSSSRGHWAPHQAPAVLAPIGVVGGIAFQERSRWPQSENQQGRNSFSPHARHPGRRRRSSSTSTQPQALRQSAAQYPPAAHILRPVNWDHAGTSAGQNAPREAAAPRSNVGYAQRRREGASAFRQYATEHEGQRWAPPPLSGLYGLHGILGSELPSQAGFGAPSMQYSNQFQGLFQASPEEELEVGPSTPFAFPR